ncbi:hypothetical protein HY490_04655 [Candidatus Woesearchaeota archaeon]|nr:hypothetical protein [Candidatus Woesearchaeota archaeon]
MLELDISHGLVPKEKLPRLLKKCASVLERMKGIVNAGGYADPASFLNLPADQTMLSNVKRVARTYKVDAVIVVGIGGPNLGTTAVQEAIQGKLWNATEWTPKVFYADTVDPKNISDIVAIAESLLLQGKQVLVNVITKSGTTTETIANAQLFIQLLATHGKEPQDWLVVTTDKDSKLWQWAQQHNITVLEIPGNVVGRYSVLSPVGLFPLAVAGIDVDQLVAGAREMRNRCLEEQGPAAITAAHLYFHHRDGKKIHDTFIFSTDLEALGKWYRQLMAESLGKRQNLSRKVVHAGMTPTASTGTTDLHSMGQLYLGGPSDKFTTFVTLNKEKKDPVVPTTKGFDQLVQNIQGKSLGTIRNAIFEGVATSYAKNKLPFVSVKLAHRNEKSIGAFLQFKMMEIMILGNLWNVNPFDQPEVESYKKHARERLAKMQRF